MEISTSLLLFNNLVVFLLKVSNLLLIIVIINRIQILEIWDLEIITKGPKG